MRNNIIEIVQIALRERTAPFLQELDVQVFLFDTLRRELPNAEVFLEYPIVLSEKKSDAVLGYLDLVVQNEGKYFPIEIKLKTSSALVRLIFFGDEHYFQLKTHQALNLSCYNFWRDISRMEKLAEWYNQVDQGIGVFISNDIHYRNGPKSESVGYAQFSLKNGREILAKTSLEWNGDSLSKKSHPAILLNNKYQIEWQSMLLNGFSFFTL